MPVATLMGSAPADLQPLLSMPLPPAQFRYVAAHLGDDGDWDFQRNNTLAWLDPAFPHVAYPDGRLSMEAGLAVVREAAAGGTLVGLTITEFAPADENGAVDGSRFIERLCKAAVAD